MTEYRVNWAINIEADDRVAAAREALRIQRDLTSIATVFEVGRPGGEAQEIDLLDPVIAAGSPDPFLAVKESILTLDRDQRETLVHALSESLGWFHLVTLSVADVRQRINDTIEEAEDVPDYLDVATYAAITDADLALACECAARHCDYGDEWGSAIDHALDIALEGAKDRAKASETGMTVVCEVAAKHERLHAMHEPTDLEKFRAHVEDGE